MQKKTIFIYLLLSVSWFLGAQSEHISGRVFDEESGETLIGATITYTNITGFGTITNTNGDFILKHLPTGDSLKVSFLGYYSVTFAVSELPDDIY